MSSRLTIEIYKDVTGKEWRWHAVRKGRILFCSSEGYTTRAALRRGLVNSITAFKEGNFRVLQDGKPVVLWPRV